MKSAIFKDSKIPFFELRYVKNIPACTKMHLHEELTLTIIKEGSLKIIFNKKSFDLFAHDIVIINEQIPHCATINKKSYDGYVLYLNKKFLLKNSLQFSLDYELIQDKTIYDEFLLLCICLLDKNSSILEKEEKLFNFCFLTFPKKNKDFLEKKVEENLANKIKNYLDMNYLEELSLEELSLEFKVSIVHLIRVFKNDFGLPIHSYVLNKRVHHAKALLNKNIPIVEVALQSGFFDQSHLNRSFKRIFQLTPKQFQKNLLS
ncbi:AraC family transcriptional regulator [Halarcobacter mediterraneus]|uniref:AraC family transcriptional regulator n=1 Tax=Halarcobacter mediterraneus TaxID=2023153 RepID=A0A4Q1AUC9_9BACT|nr:helix-turn-helix transcriptional regulator [Halarcobacter mediterraneus]RXK12150.1 AraC family transcriptional regulator [Halarcobacter mediterraneus]